MHYDYKLYTIMDTTHDLIQHIETTTANVHDSQVNLSEKGNVIYRDRRYQGAKCKGYSAAMKRGARGHPHPIGIWDKLRNMRISRKRSKGGETLCSDQKCFSCRVGEGNNIAKSESDKYDGCILL